MKKGAVIILTMSMLIIPFASAGFFDFFKKDGDVRFAQQEQTDVSVTVAVGPTAPTIVSVDAIPDVTLLPFPILTTDVIFNFVAEDANGAADLNDATATASFSKAGEITRTDPLCNFVSESGNQRTYGCTVPMEFYDDNGVWDISVSVDDQSGSMAQDSTTSFNVQLTRDISITPTSIGFPTIAPAANDTLSSSTTLITNQGNSEIPGDGSLSVTAFDLTGAVTPTESIPSANFRASGVAGAASVCTTGTALTNDTAVGIAGSVLPRGSTGNTETLSYCLTSVPVISSQTYSTSGVGSLAWRIGI